ncbi:MULTISPECIES: MFS transporter [unclassified Pseudomonas]|uniref:MFS transporter n=1 Tax=unclassified Pseudomonas TaxID=196821 RepID=UPI000C87F9EB|nr:MULTISPECIES: MFS transporter [unclassified Pseudomonas]PMZ95058.1 MFS transporter [Pseudomonas sp. FW305-42]PNA20389.1 MFS transporter [Pseudomonas sp. MPR-R1B]PNB24533.1 MFS transporter [Pseudomonas sp. DP16D-E2]PNB41108.1 MFS transporter [Pseudomonas sp. FW305-17]PNB58218.1 MFS transporter [Pseudomonas sp. GW531-E2]
MSPRIWLLALATFVTGMAENITVGILPALADGLQVPLGIAGQLTTVFSLSFALAAPFSPLLTTRLPLRRLLCATLAIFALCNLAAALAPGYTALLVARIGMAATSALTCLTCTLMATRMVPEALRGRAIGVTFMGICSSLVLGVPAGMLLCDVLGWRGVFTGLSVLAMAVLLMAWQGLPQLQSSERIALHSYVRHLRDSRLMAAQGVSLLMIAGHFTVFAYLAPYAHQVADIPLQWLAAVFAAFGIAGVSGGYVGGWMADRLGAGRSIALAPLLYLASLLVLPLSVGTPGLFLATMMLWGGLSWTTSPVVQSYLATRGPDTFPAGMSLNMSAMHLGVGLGSAIGGVVITGATLAATPWAGAALTALAAGLAFWSARPPAEPGFSEREPA